MEFLALLGAGVLTASYGALWVLFLRGRRDVAQAKALAINATRDSQGALRQIARQGRKFEIIGSNLRVDLTVD